MNPPRLRPSRALHSLSRVTRTQHHRILTVHQARHGLVDVAADLFQGRGDVVVVDVAADGFADDGDWVARGGSAAAALSTAAAAAAAARSSRHSSSRRRGDGLMLVFLVFFSLFSHFFFSFLEERFCVPKSGQ